MILDCWRLVSFVEAFVHVAKYKYILSVCSFSRYKLVQTEMFMAEDATALNKAKCQLPNLERQVTPSLLNQTFYSMTNDYFKSKSVILNTKYII